MLVCAGAHGLTGCCSPAPAPAPPRPNNAAYLRAGPTASVQLVQKKAGLSVTGELDDDTLTALNTAEALPVAAKGANLARSRTV